jgi:hypothetical protein
MEKQEIIESLNRCIYLAKNADITYIERELTKVAEALLDEWNRSDYYAQQISQVLNLEETFENLNNIKIR